MEKLKDRYAHYSPKSGKVHGADYVVGDVCVICNNEKLSGLDDYFCSLYDQYFQNVRGLNEEVELEYKYDLLVRALLKIAFNTARSAGSETTPLERIAGYICEGSSRPQGLTVIGELVSPTFVEDKSQTLSGIREIRSTLYRSALGKLTTPHGFAVLVRVVAVNSFFFHILLARDPENMGVFCNAVHEFTDGVRGAVIILEDRDRVVLRTSPQDGISSMLPLMRAKSSQYRKFFDSNKKSRKR